MKALESTAAVAMLAGVIGAGAALGGAWWLGAFTREPMSVAVVNLGGLIRGEAGGREVDQEAVDAGFAKMRRVGEALAAKGYLVLDATAVVNAPEAFYVPQRQESDAVPGAEPNPNMVR